MLGEELDEIVRKSEINAGDLETVHKLTDILYKHCPNNHFSQKQEPLEPLQSQGGMVETTGVQPVTSYV